MPSDVVSIAVCTGLGVSVFVGILSGVCYILVSGLTIKRKREPELQWLCAVCGLYLRLCVRENIKIVICTKCESRVCKNRCSRRDSQIKEWICYTCLKQPSFFEGMLNSFRLFYKKNTSTKSNQMGKKFNNDDLNIKQESETVRDFIEKLVSTIVGGSVDDASIYRIYSDAHYNALFDRYYQELSDGITNLSSALQISMQNASLSDQSPSSAHTSLKLLIEKILREAIHLPRFYKSVDNPTTSEERTYEDLLATAILNKIVNRQENRPDWSSAENVDDDRNTTKHRIGHRSSESKWNEDSTSVSSVDDYVYSDSSHGSAKYVDRVSLTIQQRIEQIPSIDEHDDVDGDLHYFSRSKPPSLIDDNSNWYLQKRQFQSTPSPVPVPMLVPNPITSAKVLIGDQEIDDTSDLSDANSECDDINTSEIPNLIVDSSLTIEEKTLNNYSSDEQTSFDSGVREDRDDCSENLYDGGPTNFVSTNEKVWDTENSSLSSYSNVERDSEYLEKYSLPTKTYVATISQIPSADEDNNNELNYSRSNLDTQGQNTEIQNENFSAFYEGSYSKKEKEKWNHPITMSHNPYSEENIRRRIQSNERFGRDYYTKQASLPSGRLKPDEADDFWRGEEISVHRAEPVTLTDHSLNSIEFENPIEHIIEQDYNYEPKASSNIDLNVAVVNRKILHKDGKTIEIRVNDKQVFSENDELIKPFPQINYSTYPKVDPETTLEEFETLIKVNEKEPVNSSLDNFIEPVSEKYDIDTSLPKSTDDYLIDFSEPAIKTEIKVNKKEPVPLNVDTPSEPSQGRNYIIPEDIKPTNSEEYVDSFNIEKPSVIDNYQHPKKTEVKTEIKINKKEPVNSNLDAKSEPLTDRHYIIPENKPVNTQRYVTPKSFNTEKPQMVISLNEKLVETPVKTETSTFRQNPVIKRSPVQTPDDGINKELPPLNRQVSSSSTVPKKSDNTWIKKIYSNPIVRNFALTNREQIPGVSENELNKSKDNGPKSAVTLPLNRTVSTLAKPLIRGPYGYEEKEEAEKPLTNNETKPANEQISTPIKTDSDNKDDVAVTHNFSLEFSDNGESLPEQEEVERDFYELREKRLVANRLGQFSKSFPNLVRTQSVKHDDDRREMFRERFRKNSDEFPAEDPGETYFTSVKDLRKLFENKDVSRYKRDKPVHSLTARSISKEMKQKLSTDDDDVSKKDGHI